MNNQATFLIKKHRSRFGGGVFLFVTFVFLAAVVFMLSMSLLANNQTTLFQVRENSSFVAKNWSKNVFDVTRSLMVSNTAANLGTPSCGSSDLEFNGMRLVWGPLDGNENYSVVEGSFVNPEGGEEVRFEVTVLRCVGDSQMISNDVALVDNLVISEGELYFHTQVTMASGYREEHDYVLQPRAYRNLGSYAKDFDLGIDEGSLQVGFAEGTPSKLQGGKTLGNGDVEGGITISQGVMFNEGKEAAVLQASEVYLGASGNDNPEDYNVQVDERQLANPEALSSGDFAKGEGKHTLAGGTYAVIGTGSGAQLAYYSGLHKDKGDVVGLDPDLVFTENAVYDNNGVGGSDTSKALEFRQDPDTPNKYEVLVRGEVVVDSSATFLNTSEYDLDIVLGEGDEELSSLEVKGDLLVGGNLEGTGNVVAEHDLVFSGQSIWADDGGRGLGLHAGEDLQVLPVGAGAGDTIEVDDGDGVYDVEGGDAVSFSGLTTADIGTLGYDDYDASRMGNVMLSKYDQQEVAKFYRIDGNDYMRLKNGSDANEKEFVRTLVGKNILSDTGLCGGSGLVNPNVGGSWNQSWDLLANKFSGFKSLVSYTNAYSDWEGDTNFWSLTPKDYFTLRLLFETIARDYESHCSENGTTLDNNYRFADAVNHSLNDGVLAGVTSLSSFGDRIDAFFSRLESESGGDPDTKLSDISNIEDVWEQTIASNSEPSSTGDDDNDDTSQDIYTMSLRGLLSAGNNIIADNNGHALDAIGFFFAGNGFAWNHIIGDSSLTFDQSLAELLLNPSALDYEVVFYR